MTANLLSLFNCYNWLAKPFNNNLPNIIIHFSLSLSMKYTPATLSKLEKILDEAKYIVRYERGNFQSGYCVLEERRVVVLNKFLNQEGKINALTEIIPSLKINIDVLTHESQKMVEEIKQLKLAL